MDLIGRPLHADFHTHSTASDGTVAPAELVEASASQGLSHIALTDHDTTQGVADALAAGERYGVTVIPGVELSTRVRRGELHILGYGIDLSNREMQVTVEQMRQEREERGTKILQRLRELGIDLDERQISAGQQGGTLGRPHIAKAMVEAGYVRDVAEGFDRFLARGRPAHVSRPLMSAVEAIELIQRAGGIAVMAHPFSAPEFRNFLPKLISAGLAGLECYYGEYGVEQRSELSALAAAAGLIATGGSDYHGPQFREGRVLGGVAIPQETIRTFLDAIGMA